MNNKQRLRILLTVLVFLAAIYRYRPLPTPYAPCNVGYESLNLGCSLANTGTLSNPFGILATGPSAHLAPLFPWMVSLLIRWFGNGPAVLYALEILVAFTLAFHLSLWPWAARKLGMGFASGAIATIPWLLVQFLLYPEWEAVYVAFLMLVLAVCMYRILRERASTTFVSLTGVLWGILLLFNPAPLFTYLGVTVWAVFFSPIRRAQKLALIIFPFAVISPWLIRNYEIFHHFILIRDNLGMEMSLGNNPCSTYSFNVNRSIHCFDHPNESMAEARKVAASGEYEYNQAKLREALAWIKGNPGRFASLTKERFLAFWFFNPHGLFLDGRHLPAPVLILFAVTPVSFAGLWMLFRRDRVAAGLCALSMLLFPPIYYVTTYNPRFRFPLLWVSFIPASFFLTEVGQMVLHRLRKTYGLPAATVESAAKPVI